MTELPYTCDRSMACLAVAWAFATYLTPTPEAAARLAVSSERAHSAAAMAEAERRLATEKELAEEKPEEEKTEKQKAREAIEWPKNWVHGYTTEADQTAARKELKQAASAHGRGKPDEKPVWITQGSGFRGSNLFASRHAAQVKDWPEQLFKLQSKERNGEGPTKILLPEGEELFFAKPAAWVEAEEEESGEEGGEEDAEALAAARAAWIKDWASLSALAGEPRPIAAICILLHTVA